MLWLFLFFLYVRAEGISDGNTCSDGIVHYSADHMAERSTVGLIVDAGSGGSRLHIYKWNKRVFTTPYPPISYPSTDESWTDVMFPGVSSFADNPLQVLSQLKPMIAFAKETLKAQQDNWCYFPIYFKATGGVRELPLAKRVNLMNVIRDFLHDRTLNPFYFEDEFARVISGEEEAVYAWAGVNFLMGGLLPPLEQQWSMSDSVQTNVKTYGTLDLGGASTQIAFYVPNQEIMEGLFKLQIGGRKHWNLYTKSFLQFGHNSIRQRHLEDLTQTLLLADSDAWMGVTTSCFHSGYSEKFLNWESERVIEVHGPRSPSFNQMKECMASLKPLLQLDLDDFCTWVYDGECGIAGQYQPRIPPESEMGFIGLSSYKIPWSVFQMPPSATIAQFAKKAEKVCSMDFEELMMYYSDVAKTPGKEWDSRQLPYHCFMGSYIVTLLTQGYGFSMNHTLTVLNEFNGNKVGWTLGAILYEINSMPWVYGPPTMPGPQTTTLLAANFGLLVGAILTWIFVRQLESNEAYIKEREESEEQLQGCETISRGASRGDVAERGGTHWTSRIVQSFPNFSRNSRSYEEIPSDDFQKDPVATTNAC